MSSPQAALAVAVDHGGSERLFAIAIGLGRHLLKDGVVEERFGLKVVLNSVGPASFRSIDKTALGSVPKHSREQMSREVTPSDFGIDIDQDLISSVTGKSRDDALGKVITGREALSISVRVDATNVEELFVHCTGRY